MRHPIVVTPLHGRDASPDAAGLVGRGVELLELISFLDHQSSSGNALAVLGGPGLGKTALLRAAAGRAVADGARLVVATGRESEAGLDLAALRELLLPLVDVLPRLPAHQARAMSRLLGLDPEPPSADRLLNATATVALLSAAGGAGRLVLLCDDVQWFDQSSVAVLAFAVRRLVGRDVLLLLGVRGGAVPRELEGIVRQIRLSLLSESDAEVLLRLQPRPPHGRLGRMVVEQADGNPMALIELARVVADDPETLHRWAAEPLPVGAKMSLLFESEVEGLPAATQQALLHAAVADGAEALVALDVAALEPAERAGLIRVDRAGPRFLHPLMRSAAYHATTFSERAAAHRLLAEALVDKPDRRAWHLAAATLGPDDEVAALLEGTARQAQERGGAWSAALALERSAELSSSAAEKSRRYLTAAGAAIVTGQSDWVRQLADHALTGLKDPHLALQARLAQGWAATWTNDHAGALALLSGVVEEAMGTADDIAWEALNGCAVVVNQSGLPHGRERVVLLLAQLRAAAAEADTDRDVPQLMAYIWPAVDPGGARAELVPYFRALAAMPSRPDLPSSVGAGAWLIDESEIAVDLLRESIVALQAPGLRGSSGGILSALALALMDLGRWDEALRVSREGLDLGLAYGMNLVAAAGEVTISTVLAMQGDSAGARTHGLAALGHVRQQFSAAVEARARHARGLADLADGDHESAYLQLHGLFDASGEPLHFHVSYFGVADLALAAVAAGAGEQGRALLGLVVQRAPSTPSPRVVQLLGMAQGLVADTDHAETHFTRALEDPAGERWPFDRARLTLAYGEWLRRRRRINEAKPLLQAAADSFRRLGAAPWQSRAAAELRAAGARVGHGEPTALLSLTPQQREVVRLAAGGLSNREIAQRLFLSTATVASHLYRSYPKLGITDRHQLSALIDASTLED